MPETLWPAEVDQEFERDLDAYMGEWESALRAHVRGGAAEFAEAPPTAESEEGRALAEMYADDLNLLGAAGQLPSEDELHRAHAELQRTGWQVDYDARAKRWAVRPAGPEAGVHAFAERAPKGGITINGTFYRGGRWIPNKELEKAGPEDRARLEAAKQGHVARRAARGGLDAAALRKRLGEHAGEELDPAARRSARLAFAALHRHHGELTLHRIEELADGLEAALAHTPKGEQGIRRQLRQRLAALHGMVAQAEAKGVTGKVGANLKPPAQAAGKGPGHEPDGRTDRGAGSGRDAEPPPEAGGPLEGKAGGPGHPGGGRGGKAGGEPAGDRAARRVPASRHEVNRRLDRFAKLFRARGNDQLAGWMEQLRSHVNEVGTDAALRELGEEVKEAGGPKAAQYEGGWDSMGDFAEAYLDRHGITPVFQAGSVNPEEPLISSLTPSESDEAAAAAARKSAGDFVPADPSWGADKLQEAQHLPGLESSEDVGAIMGRPVTHLTPDVLAKMDERYGAGKWVVKPYGDEAYAGFGIFFPQRVAQISQDARDTLWASGAELAKYGFGHLRDDRGQVVGIKHRGGDEYRFGTPQYEQIIQGDARVWADRAAAAAPNEHAPHLPGRDMDVGGKTAHVAGQYMAQPAFAAVGVSDADRAAGRTIAPGEGRVHIVTRDGKAEVVPHATWVKGEWLPVVFESDDTRAMARAAVDAINALPESERQGQVYAPDVLRAEGGYKVVEANPSAAGGASGYLGDSPFVIDSYVSHVTGREPMHVRFIRRLLSARAKGGAPEAA